jgi:hypothetical protein
MPTGWRKICSNKHYGSLRIQSHRHCECRCRQSNGTGWTWAADYSACDVFRAQPGHEYYNSGSCPGSCPERIRHNTDYCIQHQHDIDFPRFCEDSSDDWAAVTGPNYMGQADVYAMFACMSPCDDGYWENAISGECLPCVFPDRCVAGACTGGSTGYGINGCSTCLVANSSARYFQLEGKCVQCPTSTPWLFIVGGCSASTVIAIFAWKLTKVNIAPSHSNIKDQMQNAADVARAAVALSRLAMYFGMSMQHVQILHILTTLRGLHWPAFIKSIGAHISHLFSFDFGARTEAVAPSF